MDKAKAESNSGKQEIRIRWEFIDHEDSSKSQVNEHQWIDAPEVIGLIQAAAIMPGFILMNQRFMELAKAKAIGNNPGLTDFLNSLSE